MIHDANYYETCARFNLARCHVLLDHANWLESVGNDGDAMLARENAYWVGQDATECFALARKYRNQAVTTELDSREQTD